MLHSARAITTRWRVWNTERNAIVAIRSPDLVSRVEDRILLRMDVICLAGGIVPSIVVDQYGLMCILCWIRDGGAVCITV